MSVFAAEQIAERLAANGLLSGRTVERRQDFCDFIEAAAEFALEIGAMCQAIRHATSDEDIVDALSAFSVDADHFLSHASTCMVLDTTITTFAARWLDDGSPEGA